MIRGDTMVEEQQQSSLHGLTLDQKTIDVLVANIIPTSKYFESRFDNLQYQVTEIKEDIKNLEIRIDKRFEQVDAQFIAVRSEIKDLETRMDKRFEQVDAQFIAVRSEIKDLETRMDKRFEQVDAQFIAVRSEIKDLETRMDKRFEQVDDKLDKLIERIDRRIDEGLRENRSQMMRMFTFAMTFSAISMIGLIGKMLKLF